MVVNKNKSIGLLNFNGFLKKIVYSSFIFSVVNKFFSPNLNKKKGKRFLFPLKIYSNCLRTIVRLRCHKAIAGPINRCKTHIESCAFIAHATLMFHNKQNHRNLQLIPNNSLKSRLLHLKCICLNPGFIWFLQNLNFFFVALYKKLTV